MKKIIRPFVALVLSSAAGAHAQQLLTTDDGIGLRGTVRLLQSNAATCNVLEANEPSYEEKRVNQDQPLHLWELEFSVFNGSGRALDHLIAYYDIASPWPPCTNWTERYELEGDYVYLQVQWVDPSGRIQHTGAATPTLPNQTHTETILLLAFNGVRPQFTDWSVNYTFMEGEAVRVAETEPTAAPVASARTMPPGPLCADTAEEACWLELDASPDCYVWNPYPQQIEIDTWSGQCSGGLGTGAGVYRISHSDEHIGIFQVPYVHGEIHGTAVRRHVDGYVSEIPYVNGEINGTAIARLANGGELETPYVNGEIHGTHIERLASGEVWESPYVNGVRHGTQVVTYSRGGRSETPYVNGVVHGTRVIRNYDGSVAETPYANGERHGTQVLAETDGTVIETPYVNGERHGTRIERRADGGVVETPYVNDELHGMQIARYADGRVSERRYADGRSVCYVVRAPNGQVTWDDCNQ